MDVEKTIQTIAKKTKSLLPAGYYVVLFGSWADGKARSGSDIDIGIVGSKPLPHRTMMQMRQLVEQVPTLRKVDVVDLSSVSERFRARALKHAKRL